MKKNYNTGYLTEEILGNLLKQNINSEIYSQFPKKGRDDLLCEKYNINNLSKKFDYAFEYNGNLCLIEFDGYQHYINPINLVRDRNLRHKNTEYVDNIKVMDIPYFIQLNKKTIKYFFYFLSKEIINNFNFIYNGIDYSKFPCGFWSDNVITPAHFCSVGNNRYEIEKKLFGKKIEDEINKSLDRLYDI